MQLKNFRRTILLFAASIGCSYSCLYAQAAPPVLPSPAPLPADESPENIALHLCRYSRGAFPNWVLYRALTPYLSDSEAKAIQYIADRMLREYASFNQNKYIAVSSFIAEHSICEPRQDNSYKQQDNTGAIGFQMIQKFPVVPNIPDVQCDADDSEICIKQWKNELEQHWDGTLIEQPIQIVLEKQNNRYIMRSNLEDSYALPLRIQSFWQSLDHYDFDDAASHLWDICALNHKWCKRLQAHLYTDIQFAEASVAEYIQQIEITDIHFTEVSLTAGSGYTAAKFTINHNGEHRISHIVYKTNEPKPQFCELKAVRSNLQNAPATLNKGQNEAWCILKQYTPPYIKFDAVIANVL